MLIPKDNFEQSPLPLPISCLRESKTPAPVIKTERASQITQALAFLIAILLGLSLSACVGMEPKNQAEFKGYVYHIVLESVREAGCQYGPYSSNYDQPDKRPKVFESGTIGLWDGTVFKNLTCTWKSQDGTPRSETVDMTQVLNPKVVKWEFTDVEVLRERPFQMNPKVQVELRDKLFRISVQARISTLGGPTPTGGQYLPVRVITNTLLERSGQ